MPGTGELLVIMVLVLVLFGPDKLPELARQAGKIIRKVNRVRNEMTRQINTALMDDDDDPLHR
ncbi:sec-independent protein translocase protein TatB [Abditibacteriota bacterium]|nr:sec-independent protein translocase protein TatB [Abditibacteriota bacterium]